MTYSVRQICDRYQVHEQTVLKWIANGELRAVNVGQEPGKIKPRWRITEEALKEFEEARTKSPKPKAVRRKKAAAEDVPSFIK